MEHIAPASKAEWVFSEAASEAYTERINYLIMQLKNTESIRLVLSLYSLLPSVVPLLSCLC
jgi:hypothetical protein